MCAKHIRVAVSMALSCSEQKPSSRQRHSLHASNAESRIRLIVLLTAPKIFAISSVTGKNSCRNFARLSAWWFDWVCLPHPKRKLIRSVLINGMCNFEDGIGAARRRPHRTPSLTICTSDCAVLLRSRRKKRGGITRGGRYLSMRVLSVVPRHAVTVGSLARGNGDRENT